VFPALTCSLEEHSSISRRYELQSQRKKNKVYLGNNAFFFIVVGFIHWTGWFSWLNFQDVPFHQVLQQAPRTEWREQLCPGSLLQRCRLLVSQGTSFWEKMFLSVFIYISIEGT